MSDAKAHPANPPRHDENAREPSIITAALADRTRQDEARETSQDQKTKKVDGMPMKGPDRMVKEKNQTGRIKKETGQDEQD
jgi:hypothetical protein